MDNEAKEALGNSVLKWFKVLSTQELEKGARDCPLCELYIDQDCMFCPIPNKVGKRFCKGTPYIGWTNSTGRYSRRVTHKDHLYHATREFFFLFHLLLEELTE